MSGMTVEVDFSGAFAQLDGIQERVGQAVRKATFRGALLMRKEAEARAPRSQAAHFFYSRRGKDGSVGRRYLFYPGDLKKSIYIKFIPENSVDGQRAEYRIGWREKSSQIGYTPYAHMVEFGTARTPAFPFVRPAYDALHKQAEALIIEVIEKAAYGTEDNSGN